jgi:hypothetical protein
MADWVTISSLATAGGTLVLAVATFSSVRSSNRSARVAELSLLTGMRPVLIPSREDDPDMRVRFGDDHNLVVSGHGGAAEATDGNLYLALSLRNGGSGLAVLHSWRAEALERGRMQERPDPNQFRRQNLDLYIPAGDTGYWQGAIRDREDPVYDGIRRAIDSGSRVVVDLLYGDHEGGQRTIARFGLGPDPATGDSRAQILHYWNLDREDPR